MILVDDADEVALLLLLTLPPNITTRLLEVSVHARIIELDCNVNADKSGKILTFPGSYIARLMVNVVEIIVNVVEAVNTLRAVAGPRGAVVDEDDTPCSDKAAELNNAPLENVTEEIPASKHVIESKLPNRA